jgi:hypothetical protein
MSNRRRLADPLRRQAPLTWEDWRVHAQLAALELLAASGCGESFSDGSGVVVHVMVSCGDPECADCRSAVDPWSPARPLAAEEATGDAVGNRTPVSPHWASVGYLQA